MTRRTHVVTLAALVLAGTWLWSARGSSEEREIRRRLQAFSQEFNGASDDGLAGIARAARLGRFFTDDVVVEFGRGSAPIHGRETLMGMAARLQPRAAGFVLSFRDVTVDVVEDGRAEIALTAMLRGRSAASGEESLDAREFAGELIRADGEWKVRRVVAVETFR